MIMTSSKRAAPFSFQVLGGTLTVPCLVANGLAEEV